MHPSQAKQQIARIKKMKGRQIDQVAILYGLLRKRYFFVFKESDDAFKKRINQKLLGNLFGGK